MIFPTRDIFEFIDSSGKFETIEEAISSFQKLIENNGFDCFIMTSNPVTASNISAGAFSTTWPDEWTARYQEMEYCRIDPVVLHATVRETPFYWCDARVHNSDKKAQQFAWESQSFGLADGLLFPLYSNRIGRNLISLASKHQVSKNHEVAGALYLASSYFSAALSDLTGKTIGTTRLTDREREVLSWAAAGKTAWETSEILTISERTVQGHLAAIRQKLDVATTTQAAAKAFKVGLISI